MKHVETVIIGAGISGLTTAAELGRKRDFVVLERDAQIGGYCKTIEKDGFVWDYSGHFFHFKNPEIEAWLRARMQGQNVRTVEKQSFISYGQQKIDFPFQKNIHQLPEAEFTECVESLKAAQARGGTPHNFKEMLLQRYGRGICEKFLFPYNEKLYATDLASLDIDAMGRFFPHANLEEILRNAKNPDNRSYNSTFTYPEGGAIQYVNAIASEIRPEAIRLNEAVTRIDLQKRIVETPHEQYGYQRLVSSVPLPHFLKLARTPHDASGLSWNKVLVFNLGFDSKGPSNIHWLYVPNRDRSFYRVGFYDNIFESQRMSLYVELGFPRDAVVDVAAAKAKVLEDLKREGIVTSQKLISEHHVVMDPAYVHITKASMTLQSQLASELAERAVYSIGRYGRWTYCSIEDNMIEARELVASWKAQRS